MECEPRNSRVKKEIKKKKFFRMACSEMFKSDHKTRFGAVLVLRNGKVYKSHNKDMKSHPALKKHYPFYAVSIHAELQTILSVNSYRYDDCIKGSKMYVYREDKHGMLKPAKPCPYCMNIIKEAGVKKVYFTTPNGWECQVI